MKRSEIIARYSKEIAAEMVDDYRSVIKSDGRMQYKIYIWEDGELECLPGPQGDNSFLCPRDMEPRELFYVTTISESPAFDLWDYADHAKPDDEAERESDRAEIIDWLVQGYEADVDDLLDAIIDEAEQDEKYDI